jgi:thymidylate synthase
MRSSDAWLGVPYDIHAFAMMTALVALYLRDSLGPLRLGELVVSVGSQHLYHLDRETATVCAARDDERFDGLEPLHLDELAGPRDLVDHLWAVARRDVAGLRCGWLRETMG